jgi:hypothetical protein
MALYGAAMNRAVKRETGKMPVRSRHCNSESGYFYATIIKWEGNSLDVDLESGNLP